MHATQMMAGAQGNPKNGNYKTRICLNWHKTGGCQVFMFVSVFICECVSTGTKQVAATYIYMYLYIFACVFASVMGLFKSAISVFVCLFWHCPCTSVCVTLQYRALPFYSLSMCGSLLPLFRHLSLLHAAISCTAVLLSFDAWVSFATNQIFQYAANCNFSHGRRKVWYRTSLFELSFSVCRSLLTHFSVCSCWSLLICVGSVDTFQCVSI